MNIPVSRLIAVGAPLVLSGIGLLCGYSSDPNEVPWLILGWGSLFLGILIAYHEWNLERFLNAAKRRHSYEVMQQKYIPVLTQIESLVESAEPGDEIFSTATFPLPGDYERKLVEKVVDLANSGGTQAIFTRIISNTRDQGIQEWVAKIKDPNHSFYSKLHPFIKNGRVNIYTQIEPVGLDLLMIAGEKRKIALLGIKEENPSQYANNHFAKLISRGNTFVFKNDDMADSIYNYYGKFICVCMNHGQNRLTLGE